MNTKISCTDPMFLTASVDEQLGEGDKGLPWSQFLESHFLVYWHHLKVTYFAY